MLNGTGGPKGLFNGGCGKKRGAKRKLRAGTRFILEFFLEFSLGVCYYLVPMFTRFFYLFVIYLIGFGYSAAHAQSKPEGCLSEPLGLADLVSIALDNNPKTRIAWSQAKKLAAHLGIAQSAYYPEVGIEAYASHGRQFNFINGPDVNYTNTGANLVVSMMLYDFGRTQADVKEAQMALLAANWQVDWTIQSVLVRVLENAYSFIHAQESLQAHEDTLIDAQNMLHSSQELNRVGLRAVTDVYTAQATFALAKLEVADQRAQVDIQRGKLASSLGWDADTLFHLAPLDLLRGPGPNCIHTLITLAREQRADRMASQARLLASVQKVKKAQAQFMPRVSFVGRGGADHNVNDKANPAHYDITVNIEIPLFDGFKRTYQNRYAYAELESSEEELAELDLEIALEVLTHARSLEAAQETLVYAKDNLTSAQNAYWGILEKYKVGNESIAEVSITLRQLANARIRFSDVQTRYLVSLANLAYAAGILMPQMESLSCK